MQRQIFSSSSRDKSSKIVKFYECFKAKFNSNTSTIFDETCKENKFVPSENNEDNHRLHCAECRTLSVAVNVEFGRSDGYISSLNVCCSRVKRCCLLGFSSQHVELRRVVSHQLLCSLIRFNVVFRKILSKNQKRLYCQVGFNIQGIYSGVFGDDF